MALDSGTVGYLQAFGIGLVVAIILLLVFSFLRTRVPDVYEHRALLNLWKSYDDFNGQRVKVVTPRPGKSFFGWFKSAIFVSEDEIITKLGLDAAMFLRYLKSSFMMLSVLALVSCLIIMPSYGTGSVKNDNATAPDEDKILGLLTISLANVPPGDSRLWAALIMEIVVAVVVTFFMARDFRKFAQLRRKYVISENPANYALIVYDIPQDQLTEQGIRDRFDLMVPGQVAEVILVRESAASKKLQKKLDTAVTKRELAEYVASVKGVNPKFRPGPCGCLMLQKPKEDAIEYWKEEQNNLATEISDLGDKAKLTGSAIVLFTNRRACALLAQANIATGSTSWTVAKAGEPEGVHWPAFSIPSLQVEARMYAVFVFVVIFTLFWTIPATAIVGLANLRNLAGNPAFSWLEPVLDWSPAVTGLIEGLLPPTLMAVLISLIPTLFRFVVGQERIGSLAVIERKTRDYFYCFTIYGAFFSIALGSSLISRIPEIRDNPTSIIPALAEGTPRQGLYFATYIIVQTFIPLSLQLSGIVRVILRCIFLKISKTERQKRKARSGGSLFQLFRYYGQAMLVSFLALMYSSLQPFVIISGVIYFGFASIVFTYMLSFMSYSPWDGGGEMYPGAYWGTMGGLICKQIITISIIALNEGASQSIIMIIPLLATIVVSLGVNKRYRAISDHGSLHDMFAESAKLDEVPTGYRNVYEQPAGKVTHYTNLNGVEDLEDVYEQANYDDKFDGLQSEHEDDRVGFVQDQTANRAEV